jgi:hypothetical protein
MLSRTKHLGQHACKILRYAQDDKRGAYCPSNCHPERKRRISSLCQAASILCSATLKTPNARVMDSVMGWVTESVMDWATASVLAMATDSALVWDLALDSV